MCVCVCVQVYTLCVCAGVYIVGVCVWVHVCGCMCIHHVFVSVSVKGVSFVSFFPEDGLTITLKPLYLDEQ